MTFNCPREGCGRSFETLQGIKMHLSRVHGGYDNEDMVSIVGGAPGEAGVKERMAGFADSIPLGGSDASTGAEPSGGLGQQDRPAADIPPEGKRVKATPKKAKKMVAGLLEKIVVALKIEPDDEDKETLEEASNFLSDMFGVEFSIPQSKYVVESRFWAFVWVAAVIGVIFIKHNFKAIFMVKGADGVFAREDGAPSGTASSEL